MLGVILTLIAVLLVICFAFCFSEHSHGRVRADALFFLWQKNSKRNSGGKNI